jgi:hypothetical protein
MRREISIDSVLWILARLIQLMLLPELHIRLVALALPLRSVLLVRSLRCLADAAALDRAPSHLVRLWFELARRCRLHMLTQLTDEGTSHEDNAQSVGLIERRCSVLFAWSHCTV